MRAIALSLGLAVLGLGASAETAAAHGAYVTTYRPVTHYVRRTILVRERVWRPVRHRIHYRSYAPYYGYAPPYRYVASYPVYPAYRVHPWWWDRERAHERWEHERWEHHHWDY
jgi:hypothetical protein